MIKSIKKPPNKPQKAALKNTVKKEFIFIHRRLVAFSYYFCTEGNVLSSCQKHEKTNKPFFLDLNIPPSF